MTAEEIARTFILKRSGREFTGTCPACGYKGFAVTEKQGRTLFHCHAGGCTQADVIEALQKTGLWPREGGEYSRPSRDRWPARKTEKCPPAERDGADVNTEQAILAIWRRSRPIAGTVAETYLRFRGYTGPLPHSVLRLAMCRHPSDKQFHPALVAAVLIEGRADQWVAVHGTFLQPDGRGKADLDPDKMTLGPCKGGAVPLASVGPVLGVSEGVETGFSFMQATGIPTWAALSAGGIRNLILPPLVRDVVIAADNDPTGLAAAYAAARHRATYGRKVRVVVPPTGRGDFNDMAGTGS